MYTTVSLEIGACISTVVHNWGEPQIEATWGDGIVYSI